MRRLRASACAWAVAAALGGCAAGDSELQYSGEVHVTSPELVAISPDVQVVADSDEPLFYADGYYWLYRDNLWLRSDNYRGGFARVDVNIVPGTIRTLPQPTTYAHYRRHGGRAYARGTQVQTRQAAPPQGTQQYPQQQQTPQPQPQETPQRAPQPQPRTYEPQPEHRPLDRGPIDNPVPQRPQPGTTPTEPTPTSPTQKPPVPNPMPGSEKAEPHDMRSDSADKPNPGEKDKVDNSDRIDHTDRNKSEKPDKQQSEKPDKGDKKDKQRDYGE